MFKFGLTKSTNLKVNSKSLVCSEGINSDVCQSCVMSINNNNYSKENFQLHEHMNLFFLLFYGFMESLIASICVTDTAPVGCAKP